MRTSDDIKALIQMGEGIQLEFKKCNTPISGDVYPTVCTFLNTEGGIILFGVEDDGTISGISTDAQKLMLNLATSLNNSLMIAPPHPLHPHVLDVEGKKVAYLAVPVSSSVHKCKERFYVRSSSADVELKDPDLIASLVNKKRQHYYERTTVPGLTIDDLDSNAFSILRRRLQEVNDSHPWLSLSPQQILESALLYETSDGSPALTIAALLLFGTSQAILKYLPAYRIDALVIRRNLDRYDDRLIIETNLLESYARLDEFTTRHLADPLYQEGDARLSLRSKIFREVIGNMLIHRDYAKAVRSRFEIGNESVTVTNASNPFHTGPLDPANFSPHPKNPKIAKVFNELRWVEELGSGVRNIFKYSQHYSGRQPLLEDGPIFKTVIPIPDSQFFNDSSFDFGFYSPDLHGVNYRQLLLLTRLKAGQSITTQAYKEGLPSTYSLTSAKQDIKGLVEKGFLTPTGRGRGTHYIRTLKSFRPVANLIQPERTDEP